MNVVCIIPYCGRAVKREGLCRGHEHLIDKPNKLRRMLVQGFGGERQGKDNLRGMKLRSTNHKQYRESIMQNIKIGV